MVGNLNEHINSKKVESYLAKIGLRELVSEKHGKKGPATTTRNRNHKAVDEIWGTICLSIKKGYYILYHLDITSDHHLIWVEIATSDALGSQISRSKSPSARKLRLQHHRGGKKYISNSNY